MRSVTYGQEPVWEPVAPKLRPARLLLAWLVGAAALAFAAWVVPGVELTGVVAAPVVVLVIAVVNAVLPPLLAALRLPFTLLLGFLLVLFADAGALLLAGDLLSDDIRVDSFGDALLAALVMAVASIVLEAVLGTNDDDE